jgi:hypothetical protein
MALEVVGNGAVFLGDGAEVRTVLQAALVGERGEVFGALLRKVGLLAQGWVDILELLDLAHRICGARTPPAPAAAALASRVALGRGDGHTPVCNGGGSTLF